MLRETLTQALKVAMLAKDETTVGTVRQILAKAKDLDIAARPSGNTQGVGDAELVTMLRGMVKQRRESMTLYEQGHRPELAQKEAAEITVIERFLPRLLSAEETDAAIATAIQATGATTLKDMGKVMAALKATHADVLDFATVGPQVKARLGG